jgi:hypothetical protein
MAVCAHTTTPRAHRGCSQWGARRASAPHQCWRSKLATTQHTQHTTTTGLSTGSKLANSPIIIPKLNVKLTEYALINGPHANELMKGFSNGFRLGYMGPRVLKKSKNLISVKENMDEVYRKFNGEIEKGRVGGPFEVPPFDNLRCSPIGLVPTKVPGKFRLIHHLSWPEGDSVNDHIDTNKSSVKYSSFDDAIKLVQKAGRDCKLAKCDIKSAFRLLPIHPDDYNLVGFTFQDKYYFDKAMPFGCSVSGATWVKFSTFIEWLVQ